MANYISKILVNGVEYEIKDTVAREGGVQFILSTNAATTPKGITWQSGGTTITGTLEAEDAEKHAIYLVPGELVTTKNIYREFVVANTGTTELPNYIWEQIGDTEVDLKDVLIGINTTTDTVLKAIDNIIIPSQSVSASGGSTSGVIKTVTPSTQKLATTTITGVNGSASITGISSNIPVIASKATAITDAEASLVTTVSKTASKVTLGPSQSVNQVSNGTAIPVATPGSSTTVYGVNSAITNASGEGLVYNMQVNNEVLSFSTVATTTKSNVATGLGSSSITPVVIGNEVVVPSLSSTDVTFNAVDAAEDVSIPRYTFVNVDASLITNATAVNVAKPAASATTVATGSLTSSGTGGEVVTDVSTTDETVVKSVGLLSTVGTTVTPTTTTSTVIKTVTGVKPS